MTSHSSGYDKSRTAPAPSARGGRSSKSSRQPEEGISDKQSYPGPADDPGPGDSKSPSNYPRKSREELLQDPKQAIQPPAPAPAQHFFHSSSKQAQPVLSQLLRNFLAPPLRDYKACERYCRDNPEVWNEDVDELRRLSIRYLNDGKDENARRCAERWFIVTSARHLQLTTADANAYLKGLIKDDSNFQDQLDQILDKFGREIQSSGSMPPIPTKEEPRTPEDAGVPASVKVGLPVRSAVALTQNAPGNIVHKPTRRPSNAADQPRRLAPTPYVRSDTQHSPPQRRDWFPAETPITGEKSSHISAFETRKEAFQEATSEPDGAETVDDNITLDNRTASITGEKEESGPNLDLFDDGDKYKDILNKAFKLRTGPQAKSFFVKGRVFAMVWHENAGNPLNPKATEISESLDKPFHRKTRNKDGILIFSHIRHFVIVKTKPGGSYCYVLPINTYGGYGLTRKKMQREELQAHAIIHASDKNPTRLKGEVPLTKEPLAVEMVKGEVLKIASRLHFGKMQSVDWNIKAKNVGMITEKHIQRLTLYFNQEFHRGEETEVEAKPSQRTVAPPKK